MAARKPYKKAVQAEPLEISSDKDLVKSHYPNAKSGKIKNHFVIVSDKVFLCGPAKTEPDAWKLAAHRLM